MTGLEVLIVRSGSFPYTKIRKVKWTKGEYIELVRSENPGFTGLLHCKGIAVPWNPTVEDFSDLWEEIQ